MPPPNPGPTLSILVADDNELLRDSICLMLQALGHAVTGARDGQEAVDLYRAGAEGFGLVLMDLDMPRKTGQEAAREIHALDPAARVVYCSGSPDLDRILKEDPVEGVLRKPYGLGDMCDLLAALAG